jgi:hypothetical protein
MIRTRPTRALAWGLIVALLLVFAAGAYAAGIKRFSGKTSQHQSISLWTAHGYVTHLQFTIVDKCPDGHLWQVRDRGFEKIHINKVHSFSQLFSAKTGNATAKISGKVGRRKVTGKVTERRFIGQEHHFCNGAARFTVTIK